MSLILLVILLVTNQQFNKTAYADSWNSIEQSIDRYNDARLELQDNVRANPPWRVVSEVSQKRRQELYDAAIREAELQAKLYRKLKEEDR